jgi:ATP-binding cassette subfamily B protein
MSDADELPAARPSVVRAVRLAYRAEPRLLLVTAVLGVASFVPEALSAVWLALLLAGLSSAQRGLLLVAAIGLACSAPLRWFIDLAGERPKQRFGERAKLHLQAHVARLQASVGTIEHFERHELVHRLFVLRDQIWRIVNMYSSLVSTLGALVQLLLTAALLMWVHPALGLLIAFAVPCALASSWQGQRTKRAFEQSVPDHISAVSLYHLATSASSGRETRVTATGPQLVLRRRDAYERARVRESTARWQGAAVNAAAWIVFGLAFGAAVAYVVVVLEASPARTLLTVAAGANLARYLTTAVGSVGGLRFMTDAARQLAWLEDWVAAHEDRGGLDPPELLERGIDLQDVGFTYPGADRAALEHVELHLPAGSTVAIVGENGAGKTTLVKLLCQLYAPTQGRITVDGVDLLDLRAASWRARLGGAFQDFVRFELLASESVGLGDLGHLDDTGALARAADRGGATGLIDGLPGGFGAQLGGQWPGGSELSTGQWQKVALARGFMRTEPLLVVLDEPTASLDAQTEHELFERFAAQARDRRRGRVTLLVSHRFSTVRMADLIVHLDGRRVVEVGTHEDLMRRDGGYAELYRLQAAAFR